MTDDSAIKKQFKLVLNTKKHELNMDTMRTLLTILEQHGESSLKALNRYFMMPNTPFFDWSTLIGLVQVEKAKALGITDAETAWGELSAKFGAYPSMPDTLNPITKKAINAVGGWKYLGASKTLMADRATFKRAYDKYFAEYMGELIND